MLPWAILPMLVFALARYTYHCSAYANGAGNSSASNAPAARGSNRARQTSIRRSNIASLTLLLVAPVGLFGLQSIQVYKIVNLRPKLVISLNLNHLLYSPAHRSVVRSPRPRPGL